MVDLSAVEAVVADATRNDEDVKAVSISTVSAFHTPRYTFDPASRIYNYLGNKFSLHGDANSKLAIFEDRLQLIHARLMRNSLFAPPLPGSRRKHIPLTRIDDLAATSPDKIIHVTTLGILTQPEDGVYCLEDNSNAVALDLHDIQQQLPGLFTEGCTVVIEGDYYPDGLESLSTSTVDNHASSNISSNTNISSSQIHSKSSSSSSTGLTAKFTPLTERISGVLKVNTLAHPPAEPRETTLRAMDIVDPFRVFQTPAEFSRVRSLQDSYEASSYMFVILSDVHLDKPEVLRGIHKMLSTFSACGSIPKMFIFMGNFLSTPYGQHPGDSLLYRSAFTALSEILAAYPDISSETKYVFVPGPNDPGSANVLPRAPLPASIVSSLLNNASIPNIEFTTNPARIRFFTQEIVLFRHELSHRLRRKAIVPPKPSPPERAVTDHLSRTIIDQAHLCPLPLSMQPIYWEYDHALRLSPMPDVIIIAEDEDQYSYTHDGAETMLFNPGSFVKDGNFAVYRPSRQEVEHSSVQEEQNDDDD